MCASMDLDLKLAPSLFLLPFFLNNLNSRRAVSRCIFVCFLSYIFFWIFGGLVSKSRKLNAFDGLDIVI